MRRPHPTPVLVLLLLLAAGAAGCGGTDCEDESVVGIRVSNDTDEAVNVDVDPTTEGALSFTLEPGERERFRANVVDVVDVSSTVCTPMGASCVDTGETRSVTLLELDGCTENAVLRISTFPEPDPP